KYEGRVVKTMGDGFLVEFASAVEAVDCAVEVQTKMERFNSSLVDEQKVLVRIGIHVGDVVHSDGDVLGDAVNIASRVESLAEPGGICVTRQVADQVEGKVKWPLEPMGTRELRNVPNPVEVFSVGLETVGQQERRRPSKGNRIAILPFSNLSPDPNDRYFADGMTEELIATVSKIPNLSVISRASAMRYRDTSLPSRKVGSELDVGAILEGSVRKAGNRVRIAAELIDVGSDRYVWSQSFDRDLTDIFAVQGEIAQQVADGLKVQLLSSERERLSERQTGSLEAYNLYLKGRYFWNERTEDAVRKAIGCFEGALKADPYFAKAYTGLADSYLILANYEWMPPAEAGERAKEYAMKALELDEVMAEAHASLGLIYANHDWDFAKAEIQLQRAIELNPSYASAYHWWAAVYMYMGRREEALDMIGRALQLDPYSLVIRQALGVSLLHAGRLDEAKKELGRVAEESPRLPSVHFWLMLTHLARSEHAEAIEEGKKEVEADDYDEGSKLDLAFAYSETGNSGEAARIVDEVLAKKDAYYSPCSVGVALLSLGREREGKEWMEKACSDRDGSLLYFRSFPTYEKLRTFPGWTELERRMHIATQP
ncbi:MAG TPA: tetratricopeptide repeat protein, partial [Nitrososphaerales archaeon]|nr:tetratricopeptide repeat protein [Nitrososphaerales archaeon]